MTNFFFLLCSLFFAKTEDSDAFVFGGERVYKNIFHDKKYVEVYHARDADKDLGLSHNHMVALAMLLGGDYTEGAPSTRSAGHTLHTSSMAFPPGSTRGDDQRWANSGPAPVVPVRELMPFGSAHQGRAVTCWIQLLPKHDSLGHRKLPA